MRRRENEAIDRERGTKKMEEEIEGARVSDRGKGVVRGIE